MNTTLQWAEKLFYPSGRKPIPWSECIKKNAIIIEAIILQARIDEREKLKNQPPRRAVNENFLRQPK